MTRDEDYEDRPARGLRGANKDLVLSSGEFAYMQDTNKGIVKVLAGPTVFSPTGQDQPVVYDMRATRPFQPIGLTDAVQKCPIAVEGYYLTLLNPATNGNQPEPGSEETRVPELDIGRKVNIPGPCMFPLWPGQTASMVKGHHLRSNQYLLVRIYNDEAAEQNWTKAIVKMVTDPESGKEIETLVTGDVPGDISLGKQYIIRGTEVSFYIPPTGVSVVPEAPDHYVREALTLQLLEYAILVNENGNKRYQLGPAVVFPEPTETFITNARGDKKFKAYELNDIQGIYLKVIADYEGEPTESHPGKLYIAGEELFLTGKDMPIYYPREEHSLIKYEGSTKHFATAIPAGEGRYSMSRMTGDIPLIKGPKMYLPDPRHEVFVHRVLTDHQCAMWYPGNTEALEYNRSIRPLLQLTATTRGAISEGEMLRKATKGSKGGKRSLAMKNSVMDSGLVSSAYGDATSSFMADEFTRGSTYTQPRTITLNTKYHGVPVVCPYTGYAVMVVGANGERRVVEGPKRLLMEYDETLEVLKLSRGKPKNTDNLKETVYLRVRNNKVSDIVTVETEDHVKVAIKLSFRCDFEGDPNKWFEVENYVKFMTDHVRSVLSGAAKRLTIAALYLGAIDFVRDTILGEKVEDHPREGMFFKECGLRIGDVEILDVAIQNDEIAKMLLQEQHAVVAQNIALEQQRRKLSFTRENQGIQREMAQEHYETTKASNDLAIEKAASDLSVTLAQLSNAIDEQRTQAEINEAQAVAIEVSHRASLARSAEVTQQQLTFDQKAQAQRIEFLVAETEASVKKLEKFGPQFAEALTTLSNNETARHIGESFNVLSLLGGKSAVDVVQQAMSAFPGLQSFLQKKEVTPLNGAGVGQKAKQLQKPVAGK